MFLVFMLFKIWSLYIRFEMIIRHTVNIFGLLLIIKKFFELCWAVFGWIGKILVLTEKIVRLIRNIFGSIGRAVAAVKNVGCAILPWRLSLLSRESKKKSNSVRNKVKNFQMFGKFPRPRPLQYWDSLIGILGVMMFNVVGRVGDFPLMRYLLVKREQGFTFWLREAFRVGMKVMRATVRLQNWKRLIFGEPQKKVRFASRVTEISNGNKVEKSYRAPRASRTESALVKGVEIFWGFLFARIWSTIIRGCTGIVNGIMTLFRRALSGVVSLFALFYNCVSYIGATIAKVLMLPFMLVVGIVYAVGIVMRRLLRERYPQNLRRRRYRKRVHRLPSHVIIGIRKRS